ncbi:VOC family protein [Chlorogloea sp. CCALA 695]|uniref:VOC family protein n=1 Tax=Chlorogloea sp. CCALA 695 TaxID=2107693 RepID=UPI0018ED1FF7|nr:VOC family protein [Chlorogloea sp. CCALA 695]
MDVNLIKIERIDHFVLTVCDIDATCNFYSRVLGMQVVTFGGDRKALQFGNQKINLHQVGKEFAPKALNSTPGSADICLVTVTPLYRVIDYLISLNVELLEPKTVRRTGAIGTIESIYIRDPDGNLIEISNYV